MAEESWPRRGAPSSCSVRLKRRIAPSRSFGIIRPAGSRVAKAVPLLSPGGRLENSPPFQGWDRRIETSSPEGTAELEGASQSIAGEISAVLTPYPGPLPVKGRGSRCGLAWWFDWPSRLWAPRRHVFPDWPTCRASRSGSALMERPPALPLSRFLVFSFSASNSLHDNVPLYGVRSGTFSTSNGRLILAPTPLTTSASDNGPAGRPATTNPKQPPS